MGELNDKLGLLAESDVYAFHMPGHKRNPYQFDITEIDGFDDLHNPEGSLLKLKNRLAAIYGSREAYILLNGSTSGILVAISAVTNYGDTVLVARNSHKSVYNAILVRGLKAEYLYPQVDMETGINEAISPEDVEKHLANNTQIKAVVITSPTYEGVTSDIEAIAQIAHSHNIPLIVDAAHGAHFGFDTSFPRNAVELGADIVVMSLHKTLPALTQTAVMCLSGALIDYDNIDRFFHVYLTSSPSYLLMSSVEACADFLEDSKEQFEKYVMLLNKFYCDLNFSKLTVFKTDDIGKIVIGTWNSNISGKTLMQLLRDKYHLEMEMCSSEYIIAMTSVFDTEEGFARLSNALNEIDATLSFNIEKTDFNVEKTKSVMTIYEAVESKKEEISVEQAENSVSAEFIFSYPPGIPIIAPGEIFTKKIIEKILMDEKIGISLCGINKGMVKVCKLEG